MSENERGRPRPASELPEGAAARTSDVLRGAPGAPRYGRQPEDGTEGMLRFLGRLARFGLVAGASPLLRAPSPGS